MQLWHVIYRGVDGRNIFLDDQDRARFVHDLYEFNDVAPASEFIRRTYSNANVGRIPSHIRRKIVEVHGWKLMDNHVHLLLSQKTEKGLSQFQYKMTGYSRYFNERYERRGRLFDKTKKVLVEQAGHFLYVLHYVHLNGLDDLPGAEGWRERDRGTITDVEAAIEHLKADKWSSLRDYCGEKNFPSILTKNLFQSSSGEYEVELRRFLADRSLGGMSVYDFE